MSKNSSKSVAGRIGFDNGQGSKVAVKDATAGLIWEIEDKYSRACAMRINDAFTGEATEFAMVYGWDGASADKPSWQPVRPVSDRYHPIRTGDLIDIAVERLEGQPLMEEKIRSDRFGTSIEVKIPINKPIDLGKPFDNGHPWTRHGTGTRDVLYPVVSIRNAYDATSGIVVDVGLFRQICSNGAKIQLAGVGSRAIHTKHEVTRVLEEIAKSDFTGDAKIVKMLTLKKLDVKTVAAIMGARVPEKWQKELLSYAKMGSNSAWAWMNGLSYIATHEYSLIRSRQLDPVMAAIQKLAA